MLAFLKLHGLHACSVYFFLILHSLLILAALRVPLAVTWLTVYRQLQIGAGNLAHNDP